MDLCREKSVIMCRSWGRTTWVMDWKELELVHTTQSKFTHKTSRWKRTFVYTKIIDSLYFLKYCYNGLDINIRDHFWKKGASATISGVVRYQSERLISKDLREKNGEKKRLEYIRSSCWSWPLMFSCMRPHMTFTLVAWPLLLDACIQT